MLMFNVVGGQQKPFLFLELKFEYFMEFLFFLSQRDLNKKNKNSINLMLPISPAAPFAGILYSFLF